MKFMYTMKEISQKLGLPASTIRYYDKLGLLPYMKRSESGYRVFSDTELAMLNVIECLKKTDMPMKDIQQFIQWVQQGDASLQERYDMFLERRKAVQKQLEKLQKTLEFVEFKCWYYGTALEAGTEAIHQKKA